MRVLLTTASRAARVDSTVLIVGETGVGKEWLAKFIHRASHRASGPFTAVNCGAIPEALMESELFGHARGAYTGAVQDRKGMFEAADCGTLLLDEVGEMPFSMQVKLLRVLQEREIRRVGENRQRPIDVRLIAATNRNLAEAVAAKQFRQDLYYRLQVVELHVPPLRERSQDLRQLAHLFLTAMARRFGLTVVGYTPRALDQILGYRWPGNVRELENAVERACVLAAGPLIDVDDLPRELRDAHPSATADSEVRPLGDVERDYILAALEHNGGNRHRTAQQLGIGTATLFRKLRQYAGAGGERRPGSARWLE